MLVRKNWVQIACQLSTDAVGTTEAVWQTEAGRWTDAVTATEAVPATEAVSQTDAVGTTEAVYGYGDGRWSIVHGRKIFYSAFKMWV